MQDKSQDNKTKSSTQSEQITRELGIYRVLEQLGWKGCKYYQGLDISKLNGYWVEEYPLVTGKADYLLIVNGLLAGIIEAKKVSKYPLSAIASQTLFKRGF